MTMSVSTLMIFKGAATPSSVVNLSIEMHFMVRDWKKRAVVYRDCGRG
jgi:hypothetical protein